MKKEKKKKKKKTKSSALKDLFLEKFAQLIVCLFALHFGKPAFPFLPRPKKISTLGCHGVQS